SPSVCSVPGQFRRWHQSRENVAHATVQPQRWRDRRTCRPTFGWENLKGLAGGKEENQRNEVLSHATTRRELEATMSNGMIQTQKDSASCRHSSYGDSKGLILKKLRVKWWPPETGERGGQGEMG
ncbi:hypothetical protein H1C71_028811, partial [Ictidomys tridecemlineatus]